MGRADESKKRDGACRPTAKAYFPASGGLSFTPYPAYIRKLRTVV